MKRAAVIIAVLFLAGCVSPKVSYLPSDSATYPQTDRVQVFWETPKDAA